MVQEVEAFGKILEFPDGMTHEAMAKAIRDNEHKLNPDFKQPEGFAGLAKNVLTGTKQTGRMVSATIDAARNNLSGVEQHAKDNIISDEQNMPVEQRRLHDDLSAIDREQGLIGQIGDTLSAAGRNPMGTAQMISGQLTNSALSLGAGYTGFKAGAAAGSPFGPAGAAIGGTLGFLSGMFLGNVLLESGSKALEKASDEDGFTPQDRDDALREGAVKGAVITGIDAATFKLGGVLFKRFGGDGVKAGARAETKVLMDAGVDTTSIAAINTALKESPELFKAARIAGERAAIQSMSAKKKAAILGGGVAMETVGEGVGEYAGEYAATGKGDAVDATIEALSSATMSVAETAYNFNKLKSGNNLNPEGIQKVTDGINAHDLKEGIDSIQKSGSVDEAIAAANDVVSKKPTTKDDVLRAVDPGLSDVERLTGMKPSESVDQAINQAHQGLNVIPISSQADVKNILSNANVEGQISPPTEGIPNEEKINEKTGSPTKSTGILGHDSEIVLPDGSTLPTKWEVVDADMIKASIKEGINQPRDRTRAASDIQIKGIANKPDYRRLSDSAIMDAGAPTLTHDGLIVGGNGRFEGISQAHSQGTGNDYLRTLKEDAINKGIDPALIDGMKSPVLVRRITQPFDTRKLAVASNSGTSLQYSGLELAKIDADRMDGIENLDIADNGEIPLTGSNLEKIKQSLVDYSPTELASLVDGDGNLSQDGIKRIRGAILSKAYGDSPTLGRLIESTDTDARNVLGALTRSAGEIAKVRNEIKSGAIPKEVDVTENLLEAVETLAQIKTKGQPLEQYLSQESLFGDGIDSDSKEILTFLHDNIRSQKRMAEFIKDVYSQLSSIDQSTEDIFGDNTVPSKKDVIQNAKQRTTTSQSEQAGIFDKPTGKTDGSNAKIAGTETDNAGSRTESSKDSGLKFSRSPEERLKDRERAKQLEKSLARAGYNFAIMPKNVWNGDAVDWDRQTKAEAQTAERVAKIFGKRIVWIDAKGEFKLNGVVVPSIKDTIYIDVSTDKYTHAVMGHELSHHLEHDNPGVYTDMVKSLEKVIKDHDGYAAKYGIEGADKSYVIKEIVGDIMGDNFTKPEFWNRVAESNPEAFKLIADKIIKWLKNLILKAKSRSLGSEQWVTDAQKAQDIVAKAVSKYTTHDAIGNRKGEVKFNRSQGWYEFPDAIIAHRSVSDHKDYQAAKDGDFVAAVRLAKETVTPEYLADIKQEIGDSNPIVTPVRSAEKSGASNAIPEAVGMQISSELGIDFDENGIQQIERVGRTGSDGWHRIANQPSFEGDVEKNRDYVIVDDTLAQGGTVAQLKEYIEKNGGKVSLITALTGKQYSAKIGLSTSTLQLLRDKHGSIESWFKKSFGYGFEGLTESEARFIISAKGLSSEQVRAKIAEAKRDGANSNVQGNAESEVKFSRSSQGSLFGNNNNLASQEETRQANSSRSLVPDSGDTGSVLAQKSGKRVPFSAELTSDLVTSSSFLDKLDDLLKIPVDANALRQSSNTVDSTATSPKSFLNSVRLDAKALRNIIKTQSFLNEGFSGIDTKTQRLMLLYVSRLASNQQVLDSVIKFIPVDVVNDLSAEKFSPNTLLNNPAMLERAISEDLGLAVPTSRNVSDALVRAIALSGAEVSSGFVISNLERPSANTLAARGALNGNHGNDDTRHDRLNQFTKTKETEKGIAMFSRAANQSIDLESDADAKEPASKTKQIDIPGESTFRKAQRLTQDSFNRFTVIKDWLAKRGLNLSEQADVYAAEERYHAKVANQLEDFREQVRNPLIEKIQKAGFTLADVSDYLEAQHAAEANAAIQKLQNDPTATAYGITDKEAKEYLDTARPGLKELANELRDITEQTKKLRLDNGLLNKDITDAWEAAYKHYIPVKGGPDDTAQKGTGKGLKVNFKSKRRLGHGRRDEAVIENIFLDQERAIMEVERNRVGKHVVMMAAEIAMPELMTIGQPEKRKVLKNTTAFEVQVKGVTRAVFDSIETARTFKQMLPATDKNVTAGDIAINPTTDQRIVSMASPMLAENEINVYMDGHAIRVQINDELMARAYTKMGIEGYGQAVAAGRALNGYLSKVYTGYNPEFILTNMVRDFTSGFINLTGEQGIAMATKAIANYPKNFAALLKYAATNGKSSNKWIDSYRASGGNTGAAYLSDMDRLGNEVKAEYASYQGVISNIKQGDMANASRAAARKVFNLTLKWIYNLNQAGENAMRLSAFKAMIESGRTVNEAARAAKNITVNFNRKGEAAWMNAYQLFFNASVQGAAAMNHALFRGKHKYQAWALASSMAALGYMAAAAMGGGDEDEYEKIDDSTKERNLLIKSGDGYVKIPVPYGYGFFFNMGRIIADVQKNGEFGTMPFRLGALAIEELTPFGNIVNASDGEFKADQMAMGIMPTAAQIPLQLAFNKQLFTGSEIMPDSPFDPFKPERERMWRGTQGTMYDQVAGWLETGLGRDVSPESVKFLTRTFTGGAGAFADSVVSSALLAKEGAELETREIPFVRKAYTELTIREHRAAYYKAKEEAMKAGKEFDRAKKKNDLVSMQSLLRDKHEMINLNKYANNMQKFISLARDQQDAVRLSESLTVAEKRLKLKMLEADEQKIYDQYMEVFDIKKEEMRKRTANAN